MLGVLLAALAGGAVGALLLLITPKATFRAIVPYLLLAATALFASGPWLLRRLNRGDGQAAATAQLLTLFAVSVYGGYFNGGVGIVLLAGLSLLGHTRTA